MSIEAIVAKVNDLTEGEMKEVAVGEIEILLTKIKGKFHAIGAICTHYAGHLAEGLLNGERVYCPWHQSVFNAITGDLEEPPGLDAVPRFDVRVEGENVIVSVPEGTSERRVPTMAGYKPEADKRTFIILGAGGAGNAAAEALRQDGFQGRIVLITREKMLPYDRPNVSKGYLAGVDPLESLPARSLEFYKDHDLEVFLGRQVTEVDALSRSLTFADGSSLKYDALLLATGGVARSLDAPGADLENVFTLRSPEDAGRIMAAAEAASRVVVVGASFIGMEVAASLTKRGKTVTVAAPGSVPFQRTLGPEIGEMLKQVHEEKGVSFRMGARVSRLEGKAKVAAVVLDIGERLPADVVVVGVGVKPATDILKGVKLNPDGSVSVDRHFKVAEGLYAAGDLVRFPDWRTGEVIRIEHWRLALQQGRVAAHNMAGKSAEYTGVPFFWTDQFDVFLQYVGYASSWDEIIYQGKPAAQNFMAFYVKNRRILAVSACGHEREMAAVAELMRLQKMPSPEEVRRGLVDFVQLLKK